MQLTLASILTQVTPPDDPFENSPYRSIASLRSPRDKNELATDIAQVVLEDTGHKTERLSESLLVNDQEHLVRVATSPNDSAQWSSLHRDSTHSHYLLFFFTPTAGYMWQLPRTIMDSKSKPVRRGSNNYTVKTSVTTKKGIWQESYLIAS